MSKRNLTTSILGDAGSAEATVTPNLESLNTGSDAYVTSISDTSEFNVFGQLKIYDNYWDTLFARHIINAANAGAAVDLLSQVNIQGNTEGWARADHMALMVPVTFTYAWEYVRRNPGESITATVAAANNQADAFLDVSATPFPWETDQSYVNNAAVIFRPDALNLMKHAWVGVLDIFERLRILIGNNGQMLQKQIETEPIGMKYHMSNMRAGRILQRACSEWGLPTVNGFDVIGCSSTAATNATDVSATATAANEGNSETNNRSLTQMVASELGYNTGEGAALQFFRMLSSISTVSNYDTRSVLRGIAGSSARIITCTRTRNLTLPLQAIVPFFRGAKFLPPDFRFKFEIEVNSGRMIAKKHSVVLSNKTAALIPLNANAGNLWAAGRDPMNAYSQISAKCNASGIELHYPYHILRQPVQAAISAMWLQKPFLYNYETIQTTEIIPSTGSNYVNFAISISTQRPTVLDAFLFPIASMTNWETDYTKVDPFSNTVGAANAAVPTGYRIKNTPHLVGDYTGMTGIGKNDVRAGPAVWTNLEIMFSGRTAYRLQNNYMTTHGKGVDCIQPQEFFVQLFEEQSFRSTGTEYNAMSSVERNDKDNAIMMNSYQSHKLLRLIIQPGGWADRGVISSRQGATTITLNINFARPLSNNDRLMVIRTNPEQLVFDSDKNVTIIQWPAIKSNMGYLIPNITAAP